MKSILNPSFKYTPAALSTTERLREKFKKLIEEQQARPKVSQIKPVKRS